jgi:hypothetical protein
MLGNRRFGYSQMMGQGSYAEIMGEEKFYEFKPRLVR